MVAGLALFAGRFFAFNSEAAPVVGSKGETLFAGRLLLELGEDALLLAHIIHLPSNPTSQRRSDHDDDELDGGRKHGGVQNRLVGGGFQG